jgi:PKD repeat protein
VTFTDGATSHDGIVSWRWDFGDGESSDEQNPNHTYGFGVHAVLLTVTEEDGDSDTMEMANHICVSYVLEGSVSSTESGVFVTQDEQIAIELPAGALLGDGTLTVRRDPEIGETTCPAGFKAGTTCFTVDLTADLAPGANITITVRYCDADLEACGGNADLLTLSRYDDDAGEWVALPTTVYKAARTLTATTDRFSQWMVMGKPQPASFLGILVPWGWVIIAGAILMLATAFWTNRRLARR